MAQVHATVGIVVIGAAILFVLSAGAGSLMGGGSWLEAARITLTTLIGIQVTLGVIALSGGGSRPEALHFVNGMAALATLPAASAFAVEAPPRARAGVLLVAGVVALELLWRSAVTGT